MNLMLQKSVVERLNIRPFRCGQLENQTNVIVLSEEMTKKVLVKNHLSFYFYLNNW